MATERASRNLRHDRNAIRRMLPCRPKAVNGEGRVFARSDCPTAFAALTAALFLCGCSGGFDTGGWFQKPIALAGGNVGYTYTDLGAAKFDRPITANDLVDASGACPGGTPPAPGNADAGAAASSDPGSLFGGGVALGMSECDVIGRLGRPTAVNLGKNPNGLRSAILTFNSGPRPGVYRFDSGRLSEMDRVEAPASPEPEKKKVAKKKPANTQPPPKTSGNT